MSREAFETWAGVNGITEISAWLAWQAAIKYITSRPTTNTRLDATEFRKDDPETIVSRLRGEHAVPVPGAYRTAPIQHEAAREIERLRGYVSEIASELEENQGLLTAMLHESRSAEEITDQIIINRDVLNKKPAEAG